MFSKMPSLLCVAVITTFSDILLVALGPGFF